MQIMNFFIVALQGVGNGMNGLPTFDTFDKSGIMKGDFCICSH